PTLDAFTLDNAAGSVLTLHGYLHLLHGAGVNNYGTVSNIEADPEFGDTSAAFNNYGLFQKTLGSAGTTFTFAFNNYGTVDLQTGSGLTLAGPIFNSGSFTGQVDSALSLNGPFTDVCTARIDDAGGASFGSSAVVSGSYRAGGTGVGGQAAFTGCVE